MKRIAAIGFAALLFATPAAAQDGDAPQAESPGEGFSLMEEGAKILLRGLMKEMEPALRDMEGLARDLGPVMRELQAMIGDVTRYHMPEMLPNGDIIIRRKSPLEPEAPGEEGEIEL